VIYIKPLKGTHMETRKYLFEEKFKKFINEQLEQSDYSDIVIKGKRPAKPTGTIEVGELTQLTGDAAKIFSKKVRNAFFDIVERLDALEQRISNLESKSNNQ
jgi:hypothetical protein